MNNLRFVFLTYGLSLIVGTAFSQELSQKKVSIKFDKMALSEALKQINSLDGIKLSYNPDQLELNKIVSGDFKNVSIDRLLKSILGKGYEIKYRGSYAIIQRKKVTTKKSDYKFSGEIIDARTGETLKNVTVYEVNALEPTLTDEKGDFELEVSSKTDYITVAISRENYQDTLIQIMPSQNLNVPIQLQRVEQNAPKDKILIAEEFSKVANFFTTQASRINFQNVKLEEHRPYQVSLVPMLSSNGKLASKVDNKLSLNLIAGYANSLDHGIEVGGLYNILRQGASGVQLSAFGNAVGGDVTGVQMAGFINTNKGSVSGVQGSGFVNIITKEVDGAQLAGFVNLSRAVEGAQLAGFVNIATDSIKGVQGAGFVNIGTKSAEGAQLAGFLNIAANDFNGFQGAGFTNIAPNLKGTQVSGFFNQTGDVEGSQVSGFMNVGKKVKGVQLGIVNVADSVEKGATIGLINIVRKGKLELGLENHDFMTGLLTFRSGTNAFYSVLSAGMDFSDEELWTYGVGFGGQIPLGAKFYLNPELNSYNITAAGRDQDELNLLNRVSFNLGYQLTKRISLNASPVFNLYISRYENEVTGLLGDEIFDVTFSDQITDGSRLVTWLGYATSIRYSF